MGTTDDFAPAVPEKITNSITAYHPRSKNGWAYDVYVYRANGEIEFILSCDSPRGDTAPNPLCETKIVAFGNLKVVYWFPEQYRPKATKIYNKINYLLESFREK